ncbi:MAG TPA: ABC transporter permease [Blastocatellia bacterium]|nr:ABC transporter permease [Blastocatellia bacterium]
MIKDLRFGARMLMKQPGFTLIAVLTLALGIGASTIIFSAIQNILFDPYPFTDVDRLIMIQIHDNSGSRPGGRSFFQTAEFLDYQEQSHVFEEVIGGMMNNDVLYDTGNGMEQFNGGYVTPNTFRFLGVPAQLGRGLLPDDTRPGAPPVFVMSYRLWARRFNQDPGILGKTFLLNGAPTTLVGIMPVNFTKLGAELWIAREIERGNPQTSRDFWMFQAKLKRGVTLQQAQADVDMIARRLSQVYPDNYPRDFSTVVVSWIDNHVRSFRTTLYTLAAAVGLLLLIACSNVANMLLARATTREREFAIRAALGASRRRLVGQLLTESLLLALAGALVGCLFAYFGIKGLVSLIPEGLIPGEVQIRLNLPVLLFGLGTAIITAMIFGLAPALQAVRRDLVEPLKDSGKGASGGFRRGRLRNVLVVVEVALSLVLLSGACLLMRNFIGLQHVDLGFSPENILVGPLRFPRGQYTTAADKERFYSQLLERLQALPGVVSATETTSVPPYGGIRSEIDIIGKTHSEKWRGQFQLVSEGYFQTLQLHLVQGRLLSETEVYGARKVAVVNQTLVRQFFGTENPLGQMVKLSALEDTRPPDAPLKDPLFEIIGVVADAKNQGILEPVKPELFVPYTVTGAFNRGILVRTAVPPMALLENVRSEIWAVDRNIALTGTGSLEDILRQGSYAEPRFSLVLLGVFAGVGLALVALGVFSLIAYTVTRRTHEIGIRMALGAAPAGVVRIVLRMGLQLVGVGVALGLLASFAVTRVLANQLVDISPRDPLALGAAVLVVVLAGLAACYFPARRAARVDPLTALRYE